MAGSSQAPNASALSSGLDSSAPRERQGFPPGPYVQGLGVSKIQDLLVGLTKPPAALQGWGLQALVALSAVWTMDSAQCGRGKEGAVGLTLLLVLPGPREGGMFEV